MGTGYVRQSSADIVTGAVVEAAPINLEYNAIRDAFHETSGHSHDATTGEGPKIGLTTSVSGVLPVANGGFAAIHKINGTTAPTANEDSDDGYGVGSHWLDTTNDKAYVCVDSTVGAAVWVYVGNSAGWQPLDATLTALAGVTVAADKVIYATGADAFSTADFTAYGRSLVAVANEAALKTLINAEAGVDFQAYDATLAALAALSTAADKGIYATGADTFATYDLTTFARTLLDDADASTVLSTLGVSAFAKTILDDADAATALTTLGVSAFVQTILNDADAATVRTTISAQGLDATLTAMAGVTTAADKGIYFTDVDTAAAYALSSFARTLLDDADASTARTTLGLAIGTNVQAYDADLAALAALADPNADRLLFWDDSESTYAYLTPAAGLSISTTGIRVIESFIIAISDESTAITTGTAKVTFRMPYAFTLTDVRASLNTVSSSGTPTFDINEGGVSILSTKLTIDANEKTSTTAATAVVISDTSLADDAEITIDIDTAGTGAKGAKIVLIGYRP
jgi:hypothetical protein